MLCAYIHCAQDGLDAIRLGFQFGNVARMSLSFDSPFRRPEISIDIVFFMRADFEREVHIVMRRFVKRGAPFSGAGRNGDENDQ